jgi:peptidoglycan/xylan/chitin deacetylase (PgdA/CDA1 family)
VLDDPWQMLEPPEEAQAPPQPAGRRGPPGEWGGRPRLLLLAVLAAATAGAVVVASSSSHTRAPRVAVVRRAPAAPKRLPVPTTPVKPGPDYTAVAQRLAARGARVYCGSAHGDEIALTFDDGPGPETIPILQILTRDHIPATFFLIGRDVTARPKIPDLELSLGMAIGDHTETHPDLTKLSAADLKGELVDARAAIVAATGKPVVLFRPPYGARNEQVDSEAHKLGLLEVLWDVDTRDSEHAPPATILANARAGLRPGSIVLMHEDATTVQALPDILRSVKAHKLVPVTVPQLVAGGHRTRTCPYIPATE